MQLALTLYDVDHLVVDVAVIGCTPRRDHAEELRHVPGADFVVDEVAELAIAPGRKRRPVGVADRALLGAGHRLLLRSTDGHDDQLLRAWILELHALAGRNVGAGVGLEVMSTAVEDERAGPGDDEEHLLPVLEGACLRSAQSEADQTLLEPLGSRRAAVDRHLL